MIFITSYKTSSAYFMNVHNILCVALINGHLVREQIYCGQRRKYEALNIADFHRRIDTCFNFNFLQAVHLKHRLAGCCKGRWALYMYIRDQRCGYHDKCLWKSILYKYILIYWIQWIGPELYLLLLYQIMKHFYWLLNLEHKLMRELNVPFLITNNFSMPC
jgi:hypothetical protein